MVKGQSTDLARLEFTNLPQGPSEVEAERFRALFNAPIKLSQEEYLVLGGDYSYIGFTSENTLPFDDSDLRNLHVIDFNIGYVGRWNENWRFLSFVTPRISSNLIGGLQLSDFLLNATFSLWKERPDLEKPFRLIVGLSYNSTTGIPIPLPLVSYQRRFHPNWAFTLGIPKSQLKYTLGERHFVDAALFLDGYFVNLQNEIRVPGDLEASAISLSAVVGTIGYQWKWNDYLSFYMQLGHTIRQKGILRDDKRNDVYLINKEESFYFRSGLKVSIF